MRLMVMRWDMMRRRLDAGRVWSCDKLGLSENGHVHVHVCLFEELYMIGSRVLSSSSALLQQERLLVKL